LAEGGFPRPFSALGDPALEARVASDLERAATTVRATLGPSLAALLLGGGYGRGEGGGAPGPDGGLVPYNDYDLLAIVQGVPRRGLRGLRARLNETAAALEREFGLEVELSPLRRESLPSLPFTMMWCEMLGASRVVAGDGAVLAEARALPPERLPLDEALRYLTNRAALLLWARAEALPPERAWKFVQKAWLAAGAVTLAAQGAFRVGYAARDAALSALAGSALPPVPALVQRHSDAVAERLRPSTPPPGLVNHLDEAVEAVLATWQWFEERRLGTDPRPWSGYACRNRLVAGAASDVLSNVRLLHARGLFPARCLVEPPRVRVTRALPALLAGQDPGPDAAAVLGAPKGADLARACLSLWRRAS
jgi:hypothetical protein